MQPQNVLFKRKNPSIVDHGMPGVLEEIHTGSAYKSYEEQNPDTQIIHLIFLEMALLLMVP